MDTRLKNSGKLLFILILLAIGLNGTLSGLFKSSEYVNKNFFETDVYENELYRFSDLLYQFELSYKTKEEAKKDLKVSSEEIEEYRNRYGDLSEQISNIKSQYEEKINKAKDDGNPEVAETYTAERDKKLEDIQANFSSAEYVRDKILTAKKHELDNLYAKMERDRYQLTNYQKNFAYYITETTTGKTYTNLNLTEGDQIKDYFTKKEMLHISEFPYMNHTSEDVYISEQEISDMLSADDFSSTIGRNLNYEGKVGLLKTASPNSNIMLEFEEYKSRQTAYFIYTIIGIISLLLSLLLIKNSAFRDDISKLRGADIYNRLPLDVRGLLFLFTAYSTYTLLGRGVVHSFSLDYYWLQYMVEYFIILLVMLGLTLVQALLLHNTVKAGVDWQEEWDKSLSLKMVNSFRQAFESRSVGIKTLIVLGVAFASGFGFMVIFEINEAIFLYGLLFLFVTIPTMIWFFRKIGQFNRIVKNTNELVAGRTASDLPAKGNSVMASLAGNINTLKHGVKESQQEQAKSERLKTELITNVSHDLRTPLTSIITYTELLKKPDLTSEERDAYLQIIDRKSKRLKVLIDDLFEVSKMASGSIDLVKTRADIVQLLQQSLAEYDEAIKQSGLQFRVSNPVQPLNAYVDGQKLWRVFENLIGNILKYSLENTRVYISVANIENKAVITFKNVTKYELGENADEMFERFKRGDTSRQTEGSGLGLAIAKSIIDLHEGSLDIEVDGDLFKVTILLDSL